MAGARDSFHDPRVTLPSDHCGQGAHHAPHVVDHFMPMVHDVRSGITYPTTSWAPFLDGAHEVTIMFKVSGCLEQLREETCAQALSAPRTERSPDRVTLTRKFTCFASPKT